MALALEEVRRIAALARLTVTDVEAEALARDMSNILGYVKKLDELSTQAVEPTAHAVDLPTLLREDTVATGLPIETALRGAPERLGDGFGVPKIIE